MHNKNKVVYLQKIFKIINRNIMKKFLFITLLAVFTVACSFDDYDARTYYNVEGVGYVYYRDTKLPAANARVSVTSCFKIRDWGTNLPVDEIFVTDSTGFFRVRFIKRTHQENVISYTIIAGYRDPIDGEYYSSQGISFWADFVKNQNKIIKIDTLLLSLPFKNYE